MGNSQATRKVKEVKEKSELDIAKQYVYNKSFRQAYQIYFRYGFVDEITNQCRKHKNAVTDKGDLYYTFIGLLCVLANKEYILAIELHNDYKKNCMEYCTSIDCKLIESIFNLYETGSKKNQELVKYTFGEYNDPRTPWLNVDDLLDYCMERVFKDFGIHDEYFEQFRHVRLLTGYQ